MSIPNEYRPCKDDNNFIENIRPDRKERIDIRSLFINHETKVGICPECKNTVRILTHKIDGCPKNELYCGKCHLSVRLWL